MNLDSLSVSELRAEAKDQGIKGYSSMKKQELIDILSAKPEKSAEPVKEVKSATNTGHTDGTKSVKPSKTAKKPETTEAAKPDGELRMAEEIKPAEEVKPVAEEKTAEDRPAAYTKPMEGRPMEEARSFDGRMPERRRPMDGRPMENRPTYGRPGMVSDQRGGARPGDQRYYRQPDQRGYYRQPEQRSYQQPEQRSYQQPEQRQYRQPDQGDNYQSQSERPMQQVPRRDTMVMPATDGRITAGSRITAEERTALDPDLSPDIETLDSGETKSGILEVMPEGYAFIRCENFLPGDQDVYVAPAQIKRFGLKTGDIVTGNTKIKSPTEKFSALLYIKSINGYHPAEAARRPKFEDMTPIFPNERLRLETPGCEPSMRIVDLLSPIGKGQRGMIVSQPKAGKTTLLKQIAKALTINNPDLHIIILLIDERPEEVTDIKESIRGGRVEVIHSTFDLPPENHKRVSEMVIERARRLVEHREDVVILLDSITRLARAYNLTCTPSGRTLSGGLDPAALHMPKKFFGAARNMREGGSLTILATALVDTGSRMDDVVFEEFKGTGNMELVLDRNLSERRIFPAIDLPKSGTRRDDLLLNPEEQEANLLIRKAFNSARSDEAVERIINLFARTKTNREFIDVVRKTKLF